MGLLVVYARRTRYTSMAWVALRRLVLVVSENSKNALSLIHSNRVFSRTRQGQQVKSGILDERRTANRMITRGGW